MRIVRVCVCVSVGVVVTSHPWVRYDILWFRSRFYCFSFVVSRALPAATHLRVVFHFGFRVTATRILMFYSNRPVHFAKCREVRNTVILFCFEIPCSMHFRT